jgi:hypothetical protein
MKQVSDAKNKQKKQSWLSSREKKVLMYFRCAQLSLQNNFICCCVAKLLRLGIA